MEKFRKTISNYGFWTGLSASVVMIANAIAKMFGISIDNQGVEDVIMSICSILVLFGVVSVPQKLKNKKSNEIEIKPIDDESQDKK